MQIFISHSSIDKKFVRRLRDELQLRGLIVWLDEAEIRVGQSIPEQVGLAVDESDIFCIVISESSARSSWVLRELNAFIPRMISRSGLIIPCRLDDALLPPLIADLKYADFSKTFKQGLASVLSAVGIKDELDRQAELSKGLDTMLKLLSPSELAFFVNYFSLNDYYYMEDIYENLSLNDALRNKLGILIGALNVGEDDDKAWFTITDKGRRLRDAARSYVSEKELTKLNKMAKTRSKRRD